MSREKRASSILARVSSSRDTQCKREPDVNEGVYIYGAGELGKLAVEYCECCAIPIIGVLDKNALEKNMQITGRLSTYNVEHPASLNCNLSEVVLVCVATLPYEEITSYLKKLDWTNIYPFYGMTSVKRESHPLQNGWLAGKVAHEEREKIKWLCLNWADEESLIHYEAFIAWHIDGTELHSEFVNVHNRYLIEPLLEACQHNNKKIMLDVGAYHGKVMTDLANAGIVFEKYIAFEPDQINRTELKNSLGRVSYLANKFTISELVVTDRNQNVKFKQGLGYCSQIENGSQNFQKAIALDDLNEKIDFLKVHTEGTERDVLFGARKTIESCKPILAFSVYHTREGLCETSYCVMKMFKGYSWYFRMHAFQGTGAFVYGIPVGVS